MAFCMYEQLLYLIKITSVIYYATVCYNLVLEYIVSYRYKLWQNTEPKLSVVLHKEALERQVFSKS